MAYEQSGHEPGRQPRLKSHQTPPAFMQQQGWAPSPPPRKKRTGLKVTLGIFGSPQRRHDQRAR
jgi:hypothetical protein